MHSSTIIDDKPLEVSRRFIRKKGLADMLCVNLRTISRWMAKGQLPYTKLQGWTVCFDINDVESFLAESRVLKTRTPMERP
jgi:excisionase family DNA binding protein